MRRQWGRLLLPWGMTARPPNPKATELDFNEIQAWVIELVSKEGGSNSALSSCGSANLAFCLAHALQGVEVVEMSTGATLTTPTRDGQTPTYRDMGQWRPRYFAKCQNRLFGAQGEIDETYIINLEQDSVREDLLPMRPNEYVLHTNFRTMLTQEWSEAFQNNWKGTERRLIEQLGERHRVFTQQRALQSNTLGVAASKPGRRI
jgi:hypothetical protein